MAVSTHPHSKHVSPSVAGTNISYEQRRQAAASAVEMVEATLRQR